MGQLTRVRLAAGAALALLLAAPPAAAQEVQLPLDEAGRIEVVDANLARRLDLFRDRYPGFVEARLFQGADSAFVLEVTVRRDGRLVRERQPLSAAAVADLRAQVSGRVALAPGTALNQQGRWLLVGQTGAMGLAFYGWAAPYVLTPASETIAGSYLLISAASFFLPLALTRDQPVSYGMTNLSRYGATRGLLHGALLYNALGIEEQGEQCGAFVCDSDGMFRRMVALMLAGSVAEAFGGYLWARSERMDPGTAATIGNGGDLGMVWGAGTAFLFLGDKAGAQAAAALALVGGGLGIWSGKQLADRRHYTWGDANLMYTTGWLGAYSAGAMIGTAGIDDPRAIAALYIGGTGLGAKIGDGLVRDMQFSTTESLLVQTGALAGAYLGAGIAALSETSGQTAATLATLGGVVGFAGTYAAVAANARIASERSALNIQLLPAGLLNVGGATGAELPLPALRVSYRF